MSPLMRVNGWAIRALREGSGVSLRALAAAIAVDPAHLSRIERGLKPASSDVLARIAVQLEVPSNILTLPEETR